MKIKRVSSVLEEVNINISDLAKTKPGGGLRGDNLVKKIEDDTPITFSKSGDKKELVIQNKDKVIDNITDEQGDYDPQRSKEFFTRNGRYVQVIDTDSEVYKLNDIEKTSDFGGGGGSSLGSVATREVESVQCLYLAYRQYQKLKRGTNNIGPGTYKLMFNEDNTIIQDVVESVKVPVRLSRDLIENYVNEWEPTFFKTANSMYVRRVQLTTTKEMDNMLSRNKHYTFYQIGYNGDLINAILSTYRKFVQKIPISKWSPADIWAVETSKIVDIIDLIKSTNSINNMSDLFDRLFDEKVLVGISLKKLSRDERVELLINKETPAPTYKFDRVIISNDPFSTINVSVIADRKSSIYRKKGKDKIDVRSFGGQKITDISCEVIGENARQGKIGLAQVNKILDRLHLNLIPTHIQLGDKTDVDLMSEIIVMNDDLKKVCDKSGYTKKFESIPRYRLISKYQSLKLATILYANKGQISNQLIQKMFYYAMSIENEIFISPKYVRVI